MEQLIFTVLLLIAFPCAVWGISHLFDKNKGEMTGHAIVVSHRLELSKAGGSRYSDNWNRMVTFRLSDGSEMELYTIREDYETLVDGKSGQLTWEKDFLLHFDPDPTP